MLDRFFPTENVGLVIAGLWGALLIASLVVRILNGRMTEDAARELNDRTSTWFWIIGLLTVAMLLGQTATVVIFALVSYLALKEYFTALPIRRADRTVLLLAYLTIPIQYAFVEMGTYGFFVIFVPVYAFLVLAFGLVLSGETKGFIRSAGMLYWGLVLTVYNLSHLAFLLVLGESEGVALEGFGLLLFALIVVQANDVAQFVWGKLLGKRKIVPAVSPGKTWEGFVLGGLTTIGLSVLLAPVLTPFTLPHAALIGAGLAITGFMGDVTLSAVKRDLGIKDMGQVLPGHGGYLDRLDSLTLSAPLFFHFTRYFYGG
jgi:phosphatidate cytidylyltransferase